jgi:hypothetical protein
MLLRDMGDIFRYEFLYRYVVAGYGDIFRYVCCCCCCWNGIAKPSKLHRSLDHGPILTEIFQIAQYYGNQLCVSGGIGSTGAPTLSPNFKLLLSAVGKIS